MTAPYPGTTRTTVFLFGLCGFLLLALAEPVAARQDTLLMDGWRFSQHAAPPAGKPGLDADDGQAVSLPHNWGWEEAQVTNQYYRGPGWYSRELPLRPEPDKRYFLRFEAASTVADVFLNDQKLGQHRGGFSAFCFEITTNLAATGTNRLTVRVDNSPQPDIAPLSGDFCIFGGLYRPVHLLVADSVCFCPTDHASAGVTWLQSSVTKEKAVLEINAEVSNGSPMPVERSLTIKLVDDRGKIVATDSREIRIEPGITPPFRFQLTVPHPHLWNGRADPYLYRAIAELSNHDSAGDTVEQKIGLRSFYVDPDQGFFLNGQPYRLRGVCRHQDVWNQGWALSNADHQRDIDLILEMGANAVRCTHYQQSDYFHSLCDEAGLLVWAEIPLVNENGRDSEFAATTKDQLLDLIRQSINHPSIFCWGLYNELRATTPDPHRLLLDLNILAHGEDPTRPTVCAQDINVWGNGRPVPRPTDPKTILRRPELPKIPDLTGWNIYPGWYFGTPDDAGPMMDQLRYTSRHGGICISEYGAGANPFQHEENCRQPANTLSPRHPEEWQSIVHEHDWAAIHARPFVWGSFVWNMFDIVVAGRKEGGVPSLNDKGLVSNDRQLKKDAFYFYQASWSGKPVVYLTSRRATGRTHAVTDVKVYSNARAVELFLNGTSRGLQTHDGNAVFIWKQVRLQPGENKVESRAQFADTTLTDHSLWYLTNTP